MGCYIWYSEEGLGQGPSPPCPLLAVPNVTADPSTASVPITVLLYNGPLLCGFNVSVNWTVCRRKLYSRFVDYVDRRASTSYVKRSTSTTALTATGASATRGTVPVDLL